MSHKEYFQIDTEVSPAYLNEILDFIKKYYLKAQPENFSNIKVIMEKGVKALFFTIKPQKRHENQEVNVKVLAENPIRVEVTSSKLNKKTLIELKEDLTILIQLYEDNVRKSTLYFAWVEGEEIIPESKPSKRKKASKRLFGSSLLLLYALFFIFNIILFIFFGLYAVIGILGIQLVIVLFADKILLRTADWNITPENPYVHIVQYQLPVEEFTEFQEKFGEETIIKMKTEIYSKTLEKGLEPTCELGEEIFSKYGFQCNPEVKSSQKVNIYSIVKEAVEKFDMPMPQIVISNNMLPNAAATGPSPSRGLVLITTGLLLQLTDEEVLTVVGHELGHLQGRDPIILFGLVSGEFILRLTILLPIVLISPLIYLFVAMGMIFFIAKFFETRADLISAIKIGKPKVLAEALRKIGYQKLQHERGSATKILGWTMWDPHPPIYFRVDRLEDLEDPSSIKYPLIESAKDVFRGFFNVFKY
ncbi:MAG: M48 family metalloprotease [Methanobacteriaceae archaeon]|nr:M48 family metalloprotease [Methanobacteriaceae archaeon]